MLKLIKIGYSMPNERITEDIVREHFKSDILNIENEIFIEEQKSKHRANLFDNASKKGTGNKGYPEFIISFKKYLNFIIVIECKADINKHESDNRNLPVEYSVDGILHYMKCVRDKNKDIDILGIAVSGLNQSELKVSNFLHKHNSDIEELQDKDLLSFNSYFKLYDMYDFSINLQNLKIIEKAVEYNGKLENYSIPTTERATLISGILLALQNKRFRDSYQLSSDVVDLVNFILTSCKIILKDNKIEEGRRESILRVYSTIKNHKITTAKTIQDKKTKKSIPNTLINDLIYKIKKDIYPLINYDNFGFDVLGKFYTEFIKYSGSDGKTGLVLTPSHITDLFCDLIDLNVDDIVYDCCCGTGGFLVASMKRMISLAGHNNEKIKNIKQNQLIGTEERADMFTFACSNMMMRGDGKSHIYNEDCYNTKHKVRVKKLKPTVAMLNPPYSVGADGQLDFILNAMESLLKGGRCIAIVQMSCALDTKEVLEKHRQLLELHTLESVITTPIDLFYPAATVATCIMIFKAHEKHNLNKPSWFGAFGDDGFVKRKKQGRIDIGLYKDKYNHLLSKYRYYEEPSFSVLEKINDKQEWCAEAYMQIDYANNTKEDFLNTIKEYLSSLFLFGKLNSISEKMLLKNNQDYTNKKYLQFSLKNLFKIEKGERLNKEERVLGEMPLLTSSSTQNGVSTFINYDEFKDRKKIFKDKITIDMLCNVFYHGYEYFSDDNIHTLIFKDEYKNNDNIYSCIFITTLLKKLIIKFAYGRQVRLKRLIGEKILLPVDDNDNIDWLYMENYIKALSYSSNL
jgi:hypothetical protein